MGSWSNIFERDTLLYRETDEITL